MTLSKTLKVINLILAVTIVFSLVGFVSLNNVFEEIEEGKISHKTGYVVENLKGDTLSTFVGFTPRTSYYFFIENSQSYPPEHVQAVKDAILSSEPFEIPNKFLHKYPRDGTTVYYKGLAGMLDKVREISNILEGKVVDFQIVDHADAADVIITLTDHSNGEYSGWTTSTVDETSGTIQKSHITIYNFKNLSKEDISTISRHELAHAFGLPHSTDPEDLMYPVIETIFPYYSPCDIHAEVVLATGDVKDDVVCD